MEIDWLYLAFPGNLMNWHQMCLDGEEKGLDDVRSHKRRYRFEVRSKEWMVEELRDWLKDKHKWREKRKYKLIQAYSFEVITPALEAVSKGSEVEQSHACREMNPAAIYLREKMCQARKSNITQRGYKQVTNLMHVGMKKTVDLSKSLLIRPVTKWMDKGRPDLIQPRTLQNPKSEAMGLVFSVLCKTKQYYQREAPDYQAKLHTSFMFILLSTPRRAWIDSLTE